MNNLWLMIIEDELDMTDIMSQHLMTFSQVNILIDELDETEETQRTIGINRCKQISQLTPPIIKICLTSRSGTDVQAICPGSKCIEVSSNIVSDDISLFIEHIVQDALDSKKLVLKDPFPQDEILHVLKNEASGMYVFNDGPDVVYELR